MAVTVIMSAVWLKLITVLCLSCTALSGPEGNGVVWRNLGESITIQCRSSEPNQQILTLKKSIDGDFDILSKDGNLKNTIASEFTYRLQSHGVFPNVDILIKNLTSDDMGLYWCYYTRFDQKSSQIKTEKGKGSVLLVVRDQSPQQVTDAPKQCEPENKNLVLVSVVISAAVLLGIITGFLIWIVLKTKTFRCTEKPKHVPTNDVYEDMRGTLRH